MFEIFYISYNNKKKKSKCVYYNRFFPSLQFLDTLILVLSLVYTVFFRSHIEIRFHLELLVLHPREPRFARSFHLRSKISYFAGQLLYKLAPFYSSRVLREAHFHADHVVRFARQMHMHMHCTHALLYAFTSELITSTFRKLLLLRVRDERATKLTVTCKLKLFIYGKQVTKQQITGAKVLCIRTSGGLIKGNASSSNIVS